MEIEEVLLGHAPADTLTLPGVALQSPAVPPSSTRHLLFLTLGPDRQTYNLHYGTESQIQLEAPWLSISIYTLTALLTAPPYLKDINGYQPTALEPFLACVRELAVALAE